MVEVILLQHSVMQEEQVVQTINLHQIQVQLNHKILQVLLAAVVLVVAEVHGIAVAIAIVVVAAVLLVVVDHRVVAVHLVAVDPLEAAVHLAAAALLVETAIEAHQVAVEVLEEDNPNYL